jgi:hypothetical protein
MIVGRILLFMITVASAPTLAAQKADPACPQQAPESHRLSTHRIGVYG